MNSGVTQRPGDDLDASIVPIEPHFAQQDAWAVIEIGTPIKFFECTGRFAELLGHGVDPRW